MTAQLNLQFAAGKMPWTTNSRLELETAITTLALQADYINRRWAQKWWENFQFVLGNQALRWSRRYDFAADFDNIRDNEASTSRSQTNLSRTVLESLAAMIYSQLPELEYSSRYDSSSRGARLAKTLEKIGEAYNERLGVHEEFDYASVMYVMYSKVYGKVSWSKSAGGTFKRAKQRLVKVPKMTTIQSPDPVTGELLTVPMPLMDPATGEPVMYETFEDVVGEDGKVVLETVSTGDCVFDVCSPFEIRYDPMAKTFNKAKWIEQVRVMDYDDFMEEYADQPGAIAEVFDEIKGGIVTTPIKNMAIRHFIRTMFSVPPTLDYSSEANVSNMQLLRNKVLVVEHYDRPTKGHRKNPTPYLAEGRRTVLANGKLCLVSTPQYRTNKPGGWHPFFEAKWLPLAPSTESTGPMSDTVQKNRDLNLTDTLMTLALQRQAASTLLVNENAGIDKNKFTGEPGTTMYCAGDPSAAAFWLSDKNPLPGLVNQYRAQVKEDVYEVSGAQDSIRGERSIGANSGYQAQLYEEREKKRTSKASQNWERNFVKSFYEKLFACLQQNAPKLDDSVIARMMRSAEGEISQSDVFNFLNGPIDYGVDVTPKVNSMQSKSKASKIATIMEMIQNPAVAQRLMEDPAIVDALLEYLEIDILRDVNSIHREHAIKENSVYNDIAKIKDPRVLEGYVADMPVVLWEDNDAVHILEHTKEYIQNIDKYKRNDTVMRIMSAHIAYHEQNMKAKMGEQAAFVAATAPDMAGRAEQVAKQPKNILHELQQFKKQKEMEAKAATQVEGEGPTASTAPAKPTVENPTKEPK